MHFEELKLFLSRRIPMQRTELLINSLESVAEFTNRDIVSPISNMLKYDVDVVDSIELIDNVNSYVLQILLNHIEDYGISLNEDNLDHDKIRSLYELYLFLTHVEDYELKDKLIDCINLEEDTVETLGLMLEEFHNKSSEDILNIILRVEQSTINNIKEILEKELKLTTSNEEIIEHAPFDLKRVQMNIKKLLKFKYEDSPVAAYLKGLPVIGPQVNINEIFNYFLPEILKAEEQEFPERKIAYDISLLGVMTNQPIEKLFKLVETFSVDEKQQLNINKNIQIYYNKIGSENE